MIERRLAGGGAGELAGLRQSVGVRAARDRLPHRLRRRGRAATRARTARPLSTGIRPRPSRPSPTTRRWSAGAAAHVNTLRLWSARAADPLRLEAFNRGDHVGALARPGRGPRRSPRCSIPSDETPAGQELRLRQEYFFSSASLQDIVRRHCASRSATLHNLPEQVAIQLNDTHPAIAIAELMRLLVDVHGLDWDEAWAITVDDLQLHQPHPAARGAGDTGRCR